MAAASGVTLLSFVPTALITDHVIDDLFLLCSYTTLVWLFEQLLITTITVFEAKSIRAVGAGCIVHTIIAQAASVFILIYTALIRPIIVHLAKAYDLHVPLILDAAF